MLKINNAMEKNKYGHEIYNTHVLQKPTDSWSQRDADTHEKTALLLLGEERGGRRGRPGEEEDEDEEKGGLRGRVDVETVGDRESEWETEVRRIVVRGWCPCRLA